MKVPIFLTQLLSVVNQGCVKQFPVTQHAFSANLGDYVDYVDDTFSWLKNLSPNFSGQVSRLWLWVQTLWRQVSRPTQSNSVIPIPIPCIHV